MCGIVAYFGENPVQNITNALKNLSYRGHDSWGFCLSDGTNYHSLSTEITAPFEKEKCWALGQTRWATHGKVDLDNAQPFTKSGFTLCHNGIITNIDELYPNRNQDESDTKTLFNNICELPIPNILSKLSQCEGDNAFICEYKNVVYVVITGNKILHKYQNVITSDFCNIQVPPHVCDKYYLVMDNKQYVYTFYPESGITINIVNDYPSMLSEIMDQSVITIDKLKFFNNTSQKILFGCGSSYNAALFMSYEDSTVIAHHATELKYFLSRYNKSTKFLAISQSGETKDVIDVVENLIYQKYDVYGLTNNRNSILAKLIQCEYLRCGPEYSVAATKTFTHTALSLMNADCDNDVEALSALVKDFVEKHDFNNYIFLGEGSYYPLALEGALKLKEVAQVWTDAMPASEIKHGPIACVNKDTLVFILGKHNSRSILSNIEQVKTRNATVLDCTIFYKYSKLADIIVPQLFAYWTAIKRKLNPNKPRGLAKAVTV